MSTMKKFIIFLVLLLVLSAGVTTVYLYSDGFLTSKNQTASVEHSPITSESIQHGKYKQTCRGNTGIYLLCNPNSSERALRKKWFKRKTLKGWRPISGRRGQKDEKYTENGTLFFSRVDVKDTGQYRCKFTDIKGGGVNYLVYLKVLDCRYITACPGENITFNCTALENVLQATTVRWHYYPYSTLQGKSAKETLSYNGNVYRYLSTRLRGRVRATMETLTILNVTEQDGGKFVCRVMGNGKTSIEKNEISLNVERRSECQPIQPTTMVNHSSSTPTTGMSSTVWTTWYSTKQPSQTTKHAISVNTTSTKRSSSEYLIPMLALVLPFIVAMDTVLPA